MKGIGIGVCIACFIGWSIHLGTKLKKYASWKRKADDIDAEWTQALANARECSRRLDHEGWYQCMIRAYDIEAQMKAHKELRNDL